MDMPIRTRPDYASLNSQGRFVKMLGIGIDDPCPAILAEISVGHTRQKRPVISTTPVFDGLADGIWHLKNIVRCVFQLVTDLIDNRGE
jgi:hypothetical protein